jgi:hypothetical protein
VNPRPLGSPGIKLLKDDPRSAATSREAVEMLWEQGVASSNLAVPTRRTTGFHAS